MASSALKQRGGYSYNFSTTPPATLFCHLCQLVARDPQLSICCGTNFCKQCLETRTSKESGCPVCNDADVVLTTYPNKMSDREIKQLVVLCPNDEEGCEWRDELGKLEDHVTTCEMQDVECPQKCGATMKRPKLDSHQKNECPCRQTKCTYCHVFGTYHLIMGEHRSVCLKVPLSCPNECGLTDVIRSEMNEHLKKCPLQKNICKYHHIGCKAMLRSEDEDEHDEACIKEHFQLMSKELVVAKEEIASAKLRVNRAEQVTQQVREKLAVTKEELLDAKLKASKAEENTKKMTGELSLTKDELVIVKQKMSKIEHNAEQMQKEFETRMLKIQEEFFHWKEVSCSAFCGILPSLDWQTKLAVSSMLLEQCNVVAPVIARITNVSEKMKNNETFQSCPFYTHCFGYRVCLTVTPNGIEECKGSEVSVGISVLTGPNDAKLNWPLRGQFTITLLNQVKNNNHHFLTSGVGFRSTNTNPSYLNAVFISKGFISHAELFAVSSVRRYSTRDIIYVQVQFTEKK